jgi:cAMP phosphodiesterase
MEKGIQKERNVRKGLKRSAEEAYLEQGEQLIQENLRRKKYVGKDGIVETIYLSLLE